MAGEKALVWDETGKRFYETGTKKGVLYVQDSGGNYPTGVAWNGLTAVTENPTGAEATPLYANDSKYLNLYSVEEFGATIEAYTSPKEFDVCDGSAELVKGVSLGQQKRKPFGFSYVTTIGNDTDGTAHGYKIHLVYGAMASPSQKSYTTINDSPEAMTLSWEITTTPVAVEGHDPTATIVIDSNEADPTKLRAFEDIIYGKEGTAARLPLPSEVKTLLSPS